MDWKRYARAVLGLSVVFFALLYALLRAQGVHQDLSFNTTASFLTNTNWQYYAGETTMTYVSQMAGLAVQNFVSAGVGIAVVIAFVRGLASRSGQEIGNFWVDLTRSILYVLLPLSIVAALVYVLTGVPQTLAGAAHVHTLAGGTQTIARGPVASQEAIKLLGTNGGGFFNVNAAHPYENPSWFSNFFGMLLILCIPASLTATYGRMVGSRRQGWAVFGAMMALFVVAVAVVYAAESHGSPAMQAAGIHGPNLEGKEQRFGIASSSLFAAVTTAASCGAVRRHGVADRAWRRRPYGADDDRREIWGGVGSGLYGMLVFVILGVFISGLMVGRTPEFLGKKIEAREIKLTVLASVGVPLLVLATAGVAIATAAGRASIASPGPQGFSETLYAYVSQANNNGSAFAGYGATRFADLLGGLAMLGGRFLPMLAVLAIAGSLAGKRVSPPGPGTLRTDTPTFVVVLCSVLVVVALLTFVPALLLGPVVQSLTHQLF